MSNNYKNNANNYKNNANNYKNNANNYKNTPQTCRRINKQIRSVVRQYVICYSGQKRYIRACDELICGRLALTNTFAAS